MERRNFLKGAVAGGALALLPSAVLAAAPPFLTSAQLLDKVKPAFCWFRDHHKFDNALSEISVETCPEHDMFWINLRYPGMHWGRVSIFPVSEIREYPARFHPHLLKLKTSVDEDLQRYGVIEI